MSEENIFAMTNDDFRQLLKTPRTSVPAATPNSVPGIVRDASVKTTQTPIVCGSNRAELEKCKEIEVVKIVQRKEELKEKKEPEKKDEEIEIVKIVQRKEKLKEKIEPEKIVMESKTGERYEIFTPGRAAYVFGLNDETAEANEVSNYKLTRIFSYIISQKKRNGKNEKKNKYIRSRLEDFKELNEKDNAPRLPSSSAAISDAMQQKDTYFLVNPAAEREGYPECYVSLGEMQDVIHIDDSGDESDECKNNTGALPKTEKNEELDRRVRKSIQQIMNKRKSIFGNGGPAFKLQRC